MNQKKIYVCLLTLTVIAGITGYCFGVAVGRNSGINDGADAIISEVSKACHSKVPVFVGEKGESFVCLTEDKVKEINDVLTQYGVSKGDADSSEATTAPND